jgi:hypothetical protein
MKAPLRNVIRAAAMAAALLVPREILAQDLQTQASVSAANIASSHLMPPPLPPAKAPVGLFRELLTMNAQERSQFLASRPADAQRLILAKLSEYEALPPEQRELRLRVTELRYYLLPLMSIPATHRSAQLEMVPQEIRPMILVRLQSWDQLSPEKQKELLDNEKAVRYLAEAASLSPQQKQVATNPPPGQTGALEESIGKWRMLTEDQRLAISSRFEEYFGLTPQERTRTLGTLSEAERSQIEKTLSTFNRLEPGKRAQCLRALNQLSKLSPVERQDFLRNAGKWAAMSPEERKAWRGLVFNISRQPPLPPGIRQPSPPLPPMPRLPPPAASSKGVATNS